MENKNDKIENIDKKVQDSLQNLEVPYNPTHWEQMTQRLNALDAAESSFDDSVRQQLENTIPAFKTNHWDLMSQQLDDLNDDDTSFDTSIREKLDNIHRNYQPKHWDLMAQRIEQEFSWKAKIMRYKVVEVGLMLLLLFTVFNYFDTIGGEIDAPFKTPKSEIIEKQSTPKSFNQGTDWRVRKQKTDTQSDKTQQPPIVSVEDFKFKKDNTVLNNDAVLNLNKENTAIDAQNGFYTEGGKNEQSPITHGADSDILTKNNADIASQNSQELQTLPITHYPLPIAHYPLPKLDNVTEKITTEIASAEPVNILRPNALTIAQLYETPVLPKQNKRDKWWRVGILGSSSLNNVSSSYVYKETKNWNFWSLSKGIGVIAGVRKKKIELETGLSYSTINYKPDLPAAILEGRIVTGLAIMPQLTQEVSLGVVKMPVNVNVHFADKKRWHIYTVTGVTANAAVGIDVTNYAPLSSSLAKASLRSSNDIDFPTYGKPFEIGIEKPKNNFYFTANIGMGVEYKITPRYSTYIQPQYEHHFSKYGIGSRSDKADAFSIQAGLKMQLGSTSLYKY